MCDVYIESLEYDQKLTLDKINVLLEKAKYEFLESIDPSPFFLEAQAVEGENQQQSGGILQAIGRLIQAVINAIVNGFKKLGQWVTGMEVTPQGKAAKVNGMNPDMVVRLMNGDIKDASEALRKASIGEMDIEEAKEYINKKEAVWNSLKSSIIPVIGLAAFFTGKRLTVDKWKSEIQGMANQYQVDTKNAEINRIAQTLPADKRDAAKQSATMIINQMQRHSNTAIGWFMDPIKTCYQKGYLTNKLMSDARKSVTKEGRKELIDEEKGIIKGIKTQTRKMNRETRTLKGTVGKLTGLYGKQGRAQRANNKAFKNRYLDTED